MAKADKERRMRLARELAGQGLGKNEIGRMIAKKYKVSLDSGKLDARAAYEELAAAEAAAEVEEVEEEEAEEVAEETPVAPSMAAALAAAMAPPPEPRVAAMLEQLKAGQMPSIEEINDMMLMRMLTIMLSAPYEKDRIAAARALTKACGLDSPEFRKWQQDAKKSFDPGARRMEILAALGLGKKS